VLFVDHRDSFVHTLADYVRRTGAEVRTFRAGFPPELLDREKPDLVFLSPGPGSPSEFGVAELVRACVDRDLPVFGVCLGLQGIVEAFGGRLAQLPYPVHGKPSKVACEGDGLFEGFPRSIEVGRYHSLYAIEENMPECLRVTARSSDGIIMAVEHRSIAVGAVQFHPESIMSLKDELGMRLIAKAVGRYSRNGGGSSLIEPVSVGDVIAADG
jgi:anthranilate synthase